MAEAKVSPMTSIIRPRQRERKHYTEDCMNDEEIEGKRMFSVEEKLVSDKFQDLYVREMTGEELNMKYIQENGFTCPVVIKDKTGLGMRLPSKNFTVNDVRQCVGSRRMLDVMDVTTQKDIEMSMKDWVKYYENPAREKLLNVISLEFSHTKLENYVESPRVVRDMDWVDCVWPRHLKLSQTESTNIIDDMKYPKVQKYCLMSVRGCYTDFHIDFGGTSVWYHILHGRKVFWLIPPSEKNIQLYEQWVLSGKQGDVFFGDTVEECGRIELEEGWTFFIPTGWIHAVYTPRDSLVFGGNFLHSFGVDKQLRIAQVEDVTRVPNKFRYPFYTEILWYLLERYVHCLMGSSHLKNQDDGGGGGCQESPLHSMSSSNWSASGGQERVKPASVAAIQEGMPEMLGQEQQPTMLLAKLDQSNMPDRDSEGKENCWQQWQGAPDGITEDQDPAAAQSGRNPRVEIVKKPHVHLTKLEVKGLKAIMQWLSQLPPNKRNVPELLKDPERLLMDVQLVIDEHLNDDPKLAATGKCILAWPDLPKKIKPKSRSGGSSKSGSKSGSNKGDKNANGARRRRTRCKKCEACMRADCGECHFCKDMKKFGGPGRMKQSCISRQCMAPVLPHTACCMVCGKDGWEKAGAAEEEEASSLMECSVCWEIVHPDCLWLRISVDHSDGVVNEDLPNSWECPKCCLHGKNGQNKQIRPSKNGRHKPAESTTGAVEDCPREGWEANVMSGSGPMWTAKRETVAALDESLVDNFSKKKVKLESDALVESPTMASFESIDRLQGGVKKHVQPSSEEARRKRRTNSDASLGGKQRRPEGEAHIRSCTRLLEPELSSLEPFVRTPRIVHPESTAPSPKDKNVRRAKPVEKALVQCQVKVLKCDTVVGGSPRRPGPGNTGPSPKRSTRAPDDHVTEEPGSTREKRMPLYVVRPAPIAESLKDRTRQGHLSAGNANMALDRDVMLCVLRFLQPEDLCRCMQVCKVWNGWCLDKRLWSRVDLTQRKITSRHLMGVVRRQPASLSLSWTNISKKLLAWLVSRLPQLSRLDLSGCSWSAAMALRTCNCPTLQALDLGWTEGLTDGHLRELLAPPPDSRPGLLESKSRLRNLVELRLTGCGVGDVSLRYITQHLRSLAKLDVSHCINMSDAGVALLAAVGSPTRDSLQVLDMSGCKKLTDTCLEYLKRCERLLRIDLRHCPEVSVAACRKYMGCAKEALAMVEAKLIEKEHNHRL